VDEDKNPIKDERVNIVLPTGEVREEKLDGSGKKKVEKIPPGKYTVKFPDLFN
jgi:hypothetical protein